MTLMLVSGMQAATRSRLATIGVDARLSEVAKLLGDTQIGLVVICDGNRGMQGVITKTDIVRRIGMCSGSACTTTAREVMTTAVGSCRSGDVLSAVLSMMAARGFVHLPVINYQRQPVGVVNLRDALRALLEAEQYEEVLLRNYVMGVGYQ